MEEFVSYPKIENINKLHMTITQKIHGTNAQVLIEKNDDETAILTTQSHSVKAGSRTRWLTPDDDNYGFARWVWANRDQLILKLGVGRHYGEWCGKGINAGEGLSGKMLVLFDWWRYKDFEYYPFLMQDVRVVPILYQGKFSHEAINATMEQLKIGGSRLTPDKWYMKPEGIVIDINGQKFKKVFDEEEVKWNKPEVTRSVRIDSFDATNYLQPNRLEKLLSQDERYSREYPDSLPEIVKLYIQDLANEGQIPGTDEEIEIAKKLMARHIFNFVKVRFHEINL